MSKAAFAGLKAVQEIRFHLCQTSKGSEGVRNFLLKSYKNMKAASPATPILIREASGVEGGIVVRQGTHTSDPAGVLAHRVVEPSSATPPSLPADAHHPSNQVSPLSDQSPHPTPVLADFGMEKKASLEGMDEKAVEKEVTSLLK